MLPVRRLTGMIGARWGEKKSVIARAASSGSPFDIPQSQGRIRD
jgi:hypothetical protein